MNVGLYSGAAGMRVGEDYQQLISENLSLQSVPGYKQSLPFFSTDLAAATDKQQATNSGNPAAVKMTRVVDFSQGPVEPSGEPYHVAIEGKAFFEVREADGSTSYTRDGAFSLSPKGQLVTSDGASVMGKGGSALTIDTSKAGTVSIGSDGSISIDGIAQPGLGFAHFDNPSASLQPGAYGRFVAANTNGAKSGLAPNDSVLQGSLEASNGNPVEQMANMIQAARIYESNSKTLKTVDDTQNQLINTLGGHAQA